MSRAKSAALSLALLHAAACAPHRVAASGSPAPPIAAAQASKRPDAPEPRWQDALSPHAPIRLGLRPRMLQSDRIYGPLWRHALGVARARSRVVAGTRLLEAIEHAEEVRVHLDAVAGAGDAPSAAMVVVVRGVPGDVDPGALVDPDGHLLWSPGPFGPVRELVHETDPDGSPNPASLFELPGRTWVIASGPARARARDAFVRPLGRPEPPFDPDALAVLALDGPALVERVHALGPSGGLASLGRGLDSVSFELRPGVEHEVRALLRYEKEDDAAAAERTLSDLKGAVERKKPPWLLWYEGAVVERFAPSETAPRETAVRVDAPLPAELIEAWLQAGQGASPARPAPQPIGDAGGAAKPSGL